jgi:hypothetical protein
MTLAEQSKGKGKEDGNIGRKKENKKEMIVL